MTKQTYSAMTSAGRLSFSSETVDTADGLMYFRTGSQIVGVIPLTQLIYLFRTAPGTENKDVKPSATKLQFPVSKSRSRRRS